MKKNLATLMIGLVALLGSQTANANLLSFDYTYSDGSVLSGTLYGTVQGDFDTVFINSFGSVSYLGTTFSSIELTDFVSLSDFPTGALQPLVSFSGNAMDIFVCPNGFTNGNCEFDTESGFYFDTNSVGVGDGLNNIVFASFNANNWNLISVPESSSIALLGLGLFGLGFSRRKKAA